MYFKQTFDFSVQCNYVNCEKGSEWKCKYAEIQKKNCTENEDLCYEEYPLDSLRKGCWSTEILSKKDIENMKKTGKARWHSMMFCQAPLCNNEKELPKNFTVDKEHFNYR